MLAVFRMDVARRRLVRGRRAGRRAQGRQRRLPPAVGRERGAQSRGGQKRLNNPFVGPFTLEISAFAVDGAEGLTMLVFTPASAADARAIEALMSRKDRAA